MSPPTAMPSYKKLAALFKKAKSDYDPSFTHGILCGHLCVTLDRKTIENICQKSLPNDKNNEAFHGILTDLYEASYHAFQQFSFEFSLILPDDKTDLNARAEALGSWCQGFLIGIAASPTPLQKHPEPEIREALNDLTEIAQVNFGNVAENEEDEMAYFELVEYVRLTALMIFNTIRSHELASQKNTLLH